MSQGRCCGLPFGMRKFWAHTSSRNSAGEPPAFYAHAVRRPRGIEGPCQPVCLFVQVMGIERLIDPHAVTDDRRVVPVAHDHLFDVLERNPLPGGVAYV